MKWRVGAHTNGCWIGTYEREKQRALRSLIRPGVTFVDVGANAGFYTLAFGRLARRIWAIEPFPLNLDNLRAHIAMNKLSNATVIAAAAAECEGEARFAAGENCATGKLAGNGLLTVRTIRLDSLPTPDAVKIDVEGGELSALRGASRWIQERRTTWLVALDDPSTADACRALFEGYEIREFAPREIIARPLPQCAG